MEDSKILFRKYNKMDYSQCEYLVSEAWQFDKNFTPNKLAEIAKYMYTKGSSIASNYGAVVEDKGEVVGFIFGYNQKFSKQKIGLLFGLNILRRIIFVRGMPFSKKITLIKALNSHQINRYKIVPFGRSEVVLFVIAPNYQGKGYGKRLLSDFISFCKRDKVKSIIVETNKLEASSFYEGVGFQLIGDFDSSLHAYATKEGQACMYEYILN